MGHDAEVIDLVCVLARQMPDAHIAAVLNRSGKSTGAADAKSGSNREAESTDAACESTLRDLDDWLRRKFRCVRLKQCKHAKPIADFLDASRGQADMAAARLMRR